MKRNVNSQDVSVLKSNVTDPNQVVLCINVTQGTDTKVKALCIEMYAEGYLVLWLEMQEVQERYRICC